MKKALTFIDDTIENYVLPIGTKPENKSILSIYDYSGSWSHFYKLAGYSIIRIDYKLGWDVFAAMAEISYMMVEAKEAGIDLRVHGILAAPPCTDFSSSGALHWPEKENKPAEYDGKLTGTDLEFENTVDYSIAMVEAVLQFIEWLRPVWWCIENPVGRIRKLVPDIGPIRMTFNPSDFGDPYTKRTVLYGNFNTNLKRTPVLPIFGSEMHSKYGGKSEKTKTCRSKTPLGFSKAFFEANP